MKKQSNASQCAVVLRYLQTHKRGLTSFDAFTKWNITRLSARIYDLRDKGHNIETYWEESKNEDGFTTRYARYFLHE